MFFSLLSIEEKNQCLALFYKIARCDEIFHEKERLLISGYAFQMGIENIEVISCDLEKIISYFATRSEIVKKSLFAETIGLILSDDIIHKEEAKILDTMQIAFDFSDEYKDEVKSWVIDMLPLYIKGFNLIGIKN